MTRPAVEVVGLRELSRSLRQFEDGAKDLRTANKRAAEYVAEKAAARVPVRSGRLQKSIRGAGQARGAVVREGTARVPYAGSVEFGGWPKGRPFVPEGRYLFPAAKDATPHVVELYGREIDALIAHTF